MANVHHDRPDVRQSYPPHSPAAGIGLTANALGLSGHVASLATENAVTAAFPSHFAGVDTLRPSSPTMEDDFVPYHRGSSWHGGQGDAGGPSLLDHGEPEAYELDSPIMEDLRLFDDDSVGGGGIGGLSEGEGEGLIADSERFPEVPDESDVETPRPIARAGSLTPRARTPVLS